MKLCQLWFKFTIFFKGARTHHIAHQRLRMHYAGSTFFTHTHTHIYTPKTVQVQKLGAPV